MSFRGAALACLVGTTLVAGVFSRLVVAQEPQQSYPFTVLVNRLAPGESVGGVRYVGMVSGMAPGWTFVAPGCAAPLIATPVLLDENGLVHAVAREHTGSGQRFWYDGKVAQSYDYWHLLAAYFGRRLFGDWGIQGDARKRFLIHIAVPPDCGVTDQQIESVARALYDRAG